MRKLLIAHLFLIVATVSTYAFTLKGVVVDQLTNKGIENVSLFLDGTTIGTLSKADGSFSLLIPDNSKPSLIVNYLGYERQLFAISQSQANQLLNILLISKAINLNAVSVSAKDPHRADNLAIFQSGLFGNSKAGSKCKILNPEVLSFSRKNSNTDNLTVYAYAEKPLIIENKELGYQISYALEGFTKSASALSFMGHPFYIDLYSDQMVPSKILLAREKAYRGSTVHFFRSLYANRLKEEGFEVYEIHITPDPEGVTYSSNLMRNLIFTRSENTSMVQTEIPLNLNSSTKRTPEYGLLSNNNPFEIRYTLESEEINYRSNSSYFGSMKRMIKQQTTLIRLVNNTLKFFSDGSLENPSHMMTIGYWSFRKLGENLPLNYVPA